MIIRGMSLPLIISCFFIGAILIIFPLIISYKAEKNKTKNEWNKIREYGNQINKKNKKKTI
tara:strand:- start:620 stop:802 length:183 start_codon:yes stop_codon:yes gene_type:complete